MEQIAKWLANQQRKGCLRTLRTLIPLKDGKVKPLWGEANQSLLNFSSNDYLALSRHPALIDEAQNILSRYGTGSGAARLMSGDLEIHHQLEREVAFLKNKDAALLFGSGYLANVGTIPALVGRHDVIFTDRLNHASIYDGCRLSGAKIIRFRHNDLVHLEELLSQHRGKHRALIVVESVYSMDGDIAPLREITMLKNRFQCLLMVDEAHATGIFGSKGSGLVEQEGADADIVMGTFGKALGSYGAYVAASRTLIDYLINRARSFIYSTALPPAVSAASLAAIRLICRQPEIIADLQQKVSLFKDSLVDGGYPNDPGPSQIIPVVIGESRQTIEIADRLLQQGVFVTAVRPPTVPEGSARLRFSITRHLADSQLKYGAEQLLRFL